MREILFRGKRSDNGEWVEGYLLVAAGMTFMSIFGVREPIHVDFETVGQFTGLLDKNGTKIFEGDVIRWNDNVDYEDDWEQSEIVWGGTDYPAFDMKMHDFESNGLSHIFGQGYTVEVIGNIHENNAEVQDAERN